MIFTRKMALTIVQRFYKKTTIGWVILYKQCDKIWYDNEYCSTSDFTGDNTRILIHYRVNPSEHNDYQLCMCNLVFSGDKCIEVSHQGGRFSDWVDSSNDPHTVNEVLAEMRKPKPVLPKKIVVREPQSLLDIL